MRFISSDGRSLTEQYMQERKKEICHAWDFSIASSWFLCSPPPPLLLSFCFLFFCVCFFKNAAKRGMFSQAAKSFSKHDSLKMTFFFSFSSSCFNGNLMCDVTYCNKGPTVSSIQFLVLERSYMRANDMITQVQFSWYQQLLPTNYGEERRMWISILGLKGFMR